LVFSLPNVPAAPGFFHYPALGLLPFSSISVPEQGGREKQGNLTPLGKNLIVKK
jgi:hypothetical protein